MNDNSTYKTVFTYISQWLLHISYNIHINFFSGKRRINFDFNRLSSFCYGDSKYHRYQYVDSSNLPIIYNFPKPNHKALFVTENDPHSRINLVNTYNIFNYVF